MLMHDEQLKEEKKMIIKKKSKSQHKFKRLSTCQQRVDNLPGAVPQKSPGFSSS